MVANDDFDGKATHLNCFYMHMIFEQKYPKSALVIYGQFLRVFKTVCNTTDDLHNL